jgi:hypothetical protein
MNHNVNYTISRRTMLRRAACGFGTLGLMSLLADHAAGASLPPDRAAPMSTKPPHFPARAKRVIFLFMHGGPSSIDTFDPKIRLIQEAPHVC